MVKLRNAAMAVALCTGGMGCALTQYPSHIAHYSIWHCDECDDFPTPAYGPGYSMMPGTYTKPPAANMAELKPATTGGTDSGNVPLGQQPPAAPPPSTTTPPTPPAALSPGPGANMGQPAAGGIGFPNTVITGAVSELPPLPAGMRNDVQVPVANR